MLYDVAPPLSASVVFAPHAIALIGGYLLGSIPFGLIVARVAGLGDIRNIGSGNIGATNVLRTGNRWAALATLLGDGAKGAIAILCARKFLGESAALTAALGAFLGHVFPVWLGFKGGKGVATLLGNLLGLYWPAGILACATWLSVAGLTRISSLSALGAALAAPFFLWLLHRPAESVVAVVLAVLVFWTHRSNIRRLASGTEPKIGS